MKIFHRDLKPDNFLLYPFGYVCLSDFGSARDYIEGKALIEDYEVMEIGDPRYTSFELLCHLQADEEFHRKADFFSLRAILFEMFTKSVLSDIIFQGDLGRAVSLMRQVPFRDRNKLFDEIIRQIVVDNTLPSVRKINPKIPKQVAIEIDRLYKGLSNLDYKHREADFTRIFSKINLCEKLILYSNKLEKKETFMRNKKD